MAGLHRKKPISGQLIGFSIPKDKLYITNIILPYRMGKVKKNGAFGSRIKLDKGIKVRTTYHV